MVKALVKTKILLFGFSRSFVLFLVSLNFLCLGSNIAFAQEFRGRDPFKVELDCSRGIINYNSAECTSYRQRIEEYYRENSREKASYLESEYKKFLQDPLWFMRNYPVVNHFYCSKGVLNYDSQECASYRRKIQSFYFANPSTASREVANYNRHLADVVNRIRNAYRESLIQAREYDQKQKQNRGSQPELLWKKINNLNRWKR